MSFLRRALSSLEVFGPVRRIGARGFRRVQVKRSCPRCGRSVRVVRYFAPHEDPQEWIDLTEGRRIQCALCADV